MARPRSLDEAEARDAVLGTERSQNNIHIVYRTKTKSPCAQVLLFVILEQNHFDRVAPSNKQLPQQNYCFLDFILRDG